MILGLHRTLYYAIKARETQIRKKFDLKTKIISNGLKMTHMSGI